MQMLPTLYSRIIFGRWIQTATPWRGSGINLQNPHYGILTRFRFLLMAAYRELGPYGAVGETEKIRLTLNGAIINAREQDDAAAAVSQPISKLVSRVCVRFVTGGLHLRGSHDNQLNAETA